MSYFCMTFTRKIFSRILEADAPVSPSPTLPELA